MPNFIEIRSVVSQMEHADGRMDRHDLCITR